MKTVTMSVRVSAEDAAFIAGLEMSGASTPSDKLRAIIAEARQRHAGVADLAEAVRRGEELVASSRRRVRDLEHRHRVQSELVGLVSDWLPQATALLMTFGAGERSGAAKRAGADEREQLMELERRLADSLFTLIESVLRLGVTRTCRGYDPAVVSERLGPSLEIARLIEAAKESKEA